MDLWDRICQGNNAGRSPATASHSPGLAACRSVRHAATPGAQACRYVSGLELRRSLLFGELAQAVVLLVTFGGDLCG
jgi:hypothetical protein